MDTTFIYFLKDPENPMKGYVGKTDRPRKRLAEHLKDKRARKCRRKYWLDSLTKRCLKPRLVIIDEVREPEGYPAEAAYIQFFQEEGYELVNSTPGGDSGPSMLGTKRTPEQLKKMSDAHSGEKNHNFGKPMSAEQKEKISASLRGEKNPGYGKPGATLGKKYSQEQCAKLRKKKLGSASNFHGLVRDRNKWRASISVAGKRKFLGRFGDEIEAAEVYDIAAKIHHGAHAVLNFPD